MNKGLFIAWCHVWSIYGVGSLVRGTYGVGACVTLVVLPWGVLWRAKGTRVRPLTHRASRPSRHGAWPPYVHGFMNVRLALT